jgi:hypothetical protein
MRRIPCFQKHERKQRTRDSHFQFYLWNFRREVTSIGKKTSLAYRFMTELKSLSFLLCFMFCKTHHLIDARIRGCGLPQAGQSGLEPLCSCAQSQYPPWG